MLTQQDIKQIAQRGISEEQVKHQLEEIRNGFPFLSLEGPAAVGNGILAISETDQKSYDEAWENYKKQGHKVVKFVPASGAASRMFKNLFAFLTAPYDEPTTDFEKTFFERIKDFAFYEALADKCRENNEGKCPMCLIKAGNYKEVVAELLEPKGLNYGNLPKGLLQFHKYDDGVRTPMEEHLVEAALYASSNGEANVHFTVSHDHLELFKAKVAEVADKYAKKFGIKYNISFSEQKPSTDTIAANTDNTPFRNDDGSLLFRPGGHGALIENLNEIDADVVFIKNIDNVVPDRLKPETVTYKQLIAGVLVTLQQKVFAALEKLDKGCTREELESMATFLNDELCCRKEGVKDMDDENLAKYLREKLNRPMRVCGVVKNVGEPGGGPFLTLNDDGTVSLQILESSQIDPDNEEYQKMFRTGTHFNPVDLVCATKDYKGLPFDLPKYVDKKTGFISHKSKNGRELKALELPGLWNGAMSNWNTVFVEVPLGTFNPVKTVNDLLREQHQ